MNIYLIPEGRHLLSGVEPIFMRACDEFSCCDNEQTHDNMRVIPSSIWDDSYGYLFVIDGRTYLAYEDPADGYRSYAVCEPAQDQTVSRDYMFNPQDVWIETREVSDNDEDVQEIVIRNATGDEIFVIATDYFDDYYPVGRVTYKPENLPCNAKQLPS